MKAALKLWKKDFYNFQLEDHLEQQEAGQEVDFWQTGMLRIQKARRLTVNGKLGCPGIHGPEVVELKQGWF